MNWRVSTQGRTIAGILTALTTVALFCLPPIAQATLADDIEAAFDEAIHGLTGPEFTIDNVTFEFFGVEVTLNVLGLALCEPADPYAPPVEVVPPLNAYGCENLGTVTADVADDESSATIYLVFSEIFLDLESSRDETFLCALNGDTLPYDGTVAADGYLLGNANVSAGAELTFVDGCYRVSLLPDAVEFVFTPEVMGSQDACLDNNMDSILVPLLAPMIQDFLDQEFASTLELMMSDISDLLCEATPDEGKSWGDVKSIYR